MDINIIVQFLINGATLGVIYALVAVGFTLFFGVLDIVQFAHGDVITVAMFSGLVPVTLLRVGLTNQVLILIFVLLTTLVTAALVGVLLARFLILPMRKAPALNMLLMTLMAGTAIREAIRVIWPSGSEPMAFPALLPELTIELGQLSIRFDAIVVLLFGIGVILITHGVIRFTRFGRAMRAVAIDAETAQVMGISYKRVIIITFLLGSLLAGVAGAVYGSHFRVVSYDVGLQIGIIGFTAAVLGGLGSILGAIVGGFVFAAIETLWIVVVPEQSAYMQFVAFFAVILLMCVWPTGLVPEQRSDRV